VTKRKKIEKNIKKVLTFKKLSATIKTVKSPEKINFKKGRGKKWDTFI
jgi:hypothetical protein